MHQAATPSNEENVATSAKIDIEQHKFVRKIVSLIIVVSAVIITLYVWGIIERHPRTDDATLRAQREGAMATINLEELHLSYCKVFAPFSGRVINLNISAGAHVSAGVPVFSLLDTSKWYVIADFREAEIRHMAPGSEAIVYLSFAPNQRFRGKVQGIGWAVKPEGEIDLPTAGVPYVKRELNWVRVAQRFPVRIEVENPDVDPFRMGASAVAIIKVPPRK